MPVRFKRPASLKEAQVFVGAHVEVYWLATPASPEGWFPAIVATVYFCSEEESGQQEKKKKYLCLHIKYEDDEEDLEWDEIFNGQPMADKTHVDGKWSKDALALLNRLAFDPTKHGSASRKRQSTSQQSVGDTSQHHSQSSQAEPVTTKTTSHESRSPYQSSSMSQATMILSQANGNSSMTHPQSQSHAMDTDEETAELHTNETAGLLPFAAGHWQGSPAGPSAEEEYRVAGPSMQGSDGSGAWNGMDDSQQVPPNKRRRIQQNGVAFGRVVNKGHHRDAPVARYNEVVQPGPDIGTSGQIAKVRLENFMCHDNLEMDFVPHVNFISGSNGSGKSASLQALQCCLGVRARDTGRASKVEQFIKTGCSHAIAAVSLWNTGHDAFNPTVYGSIITIERKITRSSSTFMIKDVAGRKVGEGKSQVDEIVEHFNISAGNPAVCMTQDTARSFAGTHNDKAKFEVYMEATHFCETIENLKRAADHVGGMLEILHRQGTHVREKQAQLEEVNQKVDSLQMIEQWQRVQESYNKVIAWQNHANIEEIVEAEQQRFNTWPDKMAKLEAFAREAAETLVQVEREHQDQRQALQDFKPRMMQMAEQSRQQMAAARAAVGELHAAHMTLQSGQTDAAELEDEKRSLQQMADTMQQSIASNSQAAVDKHAASIRVQQRATEAASASASLARQAVREADAAVDQATRNKTRLEGAAREANARVQDSVENLNRLQQSQRNPVSAFAPRCSPAAYSSFLQRIALAVSACRLHKPPVGPIGSKLTLQDDKWATAVEVAIGRAFSTFIVHDFEDQSTLRSIAKDSGITDLSVFICRFDMPAQDIHCGRVPPPPPHLETVLKVLTLPEDEGPIIRNALIIQMSVERLVLVDHQKTAMELVRAQTGKQGAIITRCFTQNGGQAYGRKSSETWVPAYRTPQARLSRNVAGQIAQVQADLQVAQSAAADAARELEEARAEDREAKQVREQAIRGKKQAEREKGVAESQLEELTSQQPDDADAATSALQDALKAISDKDAEIRVLQQKLEEQAQAHQEACERESAARAACAELEQRKQQLVNDNAACESAIGDVFQRKEEAVQHVHYYNQKRQDWSATVAAAQRELQEHIQKRDALQQQAEQVCSLEEGLAAREDLIKTWEEDGWSQEKIKSNLELDELVRRSASVAAKIAQKEKDAGMDLDTLRVMQHQLQNQVSKLELKFSKVESAHQLLSDGILRRRHSSKAMRIKTEQTVNVLFNTLLFKRGFQGNIKLNYDLGKMDMKVRVEGESGSKHSITKDMKSLSGGERSFITVCFMLAVAQVISSPFHCMDEFDVFMDAINRRISMITLLDFAVQNSDVQLILLSPQDIAAIEEAKQHVQKDKGFPHNAYIKVVQMRHQRHGADHS